MRGRRTTLAPRSATGQDGDTLPASPHRGRRPPTPHTSQPSAPAAGMKDAHHPLHHEGEPPHLPPGEPSTWLTKDPTDTTPRGTLQRAAEPPPHQLPPSELYLCMCVRYGPPHLGQLCLGGWCPCPRPCTDHSLTAPMQGSCPTPQHLAAPRGPNPAPRMGARCPLVSTGHKQHWGPGF